MFVKKIFKVLKVSALVIGLFVFYMVLIFFLGQKYWWYNWDDDAIFPPLVDPVTAFLSPLWCPRIDESPFIYEYPANGETKVDKNNLVVFQSKDGYSFTVIDIEDTKGVEYGLLPYGTVTYVGTEIFDRQVIYPQGDRTGSWAQKVRVSSNDDLRNRKESWGGWKEGNDVTIRIAYQPDNSKCPYPYIYKFKTGSVVEAN